MLHPLASLWRRGARVSFYDSAGLVGRQHSTAMSVGLAPAMAVQRRFSSTDDAIHYLRSWVGEPAARAELKSILQRSGVSLVGNYAGVDGWINALAGRLAAGTIVVLEGAGNLGRPGRLVAPASATISAAAIAALPMLSEFVAPVALVKPVAVAPEAKLTSESLHDAVAALNAPSTSQESYSAAATEQIVQAAAFERAAVTGAAFCEVCARQQAAVAVEPETAAQIAQAETLEQAAIAGAPFCEICSKLQNGKQDRPHDVDQLAQAVTLEKAAVEGSAFCEICAKHQPEQGKDING